MRKTVRLGGLWGLAILFVVVSLASCGGGGGGGGDAGPGSTAAAVLTGTASGTVIDGPINGATVQVFDFTGNQQGLLLGAGVTDANGNYTITLTPRPTGPVKVVASGGSYINEATGTQ